MVTTKSVDAWWAVLRRGVLCAAVRQRTWMCPTLHRRQRHLWLRLTARLITARQERAPSSCVAPALWRKPTFPIEIFAGVCEKTPNSTAQLGRAH